MIAASADLQTLFDASKRSIDPTKTGGLRLRWRMATEARLRSLTKLVRSAIIGEDILGLGKVSLASISFNGMQGGDRLRAWSTWITDAVYATLVGNDDGAWVGEHVGAAYNFGLKTAQEELLPAEVDPAKLNTERYGVLQSLAQNELQGIADATVQQIVRSVAASIVSEHSPTKMYRLIIEVIDKIAAVRTRALVNMMVVKAYNEAKLDVYRAGGITRIGTVAELLPPKSPGVKDHAHTHARDAGFSGPGSRISRSATPSASTIGRIYRAYQKLKELGSVEVLTAGDDDVCPECEDISQEGPYEIDEAEGLIPAHPNCRCKFVPAFDERFAERESEDSLPLALQKFAGVGDAGWNEEDHPRSPDGKFGEGGGDEPKSDPLGSAGRTAELESKLKAAVPGLTEVKSNELKKSAPGTHQLLMSTERGKSFGSKPGNPITLPGHESATGIALRVDAKNMTIKIDEVNSHEKGAGEKMVKAVIENSPGYKIKAIDLSGLKQKGEGQTFWQKMAGKYPNKIEVS